MTTAQQITDQKSFIRLRSCGCGGLLATQAPADLHSTDTQEAQAANLEVCHPVYTPVVTTS
jgi:hypothetical protein